MDSHNNPFTSNELPLTLCCSTTANQRELVSDFLRKAKQLEYLIASLPSTSGTDEEEQAEFEELENEMQAVNAEYLEALGVAGELGFPLSALMLLTDRSNVTEQLHEEIQISLRNALDARTIPPPTSAP